MREVSRGVLVLAALGALLTVGGCDAIRQLVAGQVVEPRFAGPFLTEPDITQISNRAPDRITSSATMIYFLWTHPDATQGVPYQCRVVAMNVAGVPPNTEVGQVSGTSSPNTIGGQVQFAMSPGTLAPGAYRAEISLRGQPFGTADFQVFAQ